MKPFLKTFFALAAVAALTACDQSSLLPEGSLSGATGTLAIAAVHHLHDGSALAADGSGAKVLLNDLDFQITLTHASIGYRSLSLVSSGDDPECAGGDDVMIAINGSDDLLGEDLVETSLGEHAIPLASFCSYELVLGPSGEPPTLKFHAGEDHTDELHGAHATLHLTGTWAQDGGAETPFEIETEEEVIVNGTFAHPLHFHEGETETAKAFSVSYDALFDGIDFGAMDDAAIVEEVLHNLAHASGLYRGGGLDNEEDL